MVCKVETKRGQAFGRAGDMSSGGCSDHMSHISTTWLGTHDKECG